MLARSISPRGRTILICELVTLGIIVGIGFALEAVSPGWWGITRDAFSRLAEPAETAEGSQPHVSILIHGRPHVFLSGENVADPEDSASFIARMLRGLTNPKCLKQALATPKVARLELIDAIPKKDRVAALRAMIHVQSDIQTFYANAKLTCRQGTRDEKVILLNALADAYSELYIDDLKQHEKYELEEMEMYRVELQGRLATLRKLDSARPSSKDQTVEIGAIERILNRLSDQIELRKLNKHSYQRVSVLSMAE